MANKALIFLTLMGACLVMVCSEKEQFAACDTKVIECIKEVNGGSYPVHAWTGFSILLNRKYSIVWCSEHFIKGHGATCINTVFGLFGANDTYYNGNEKIQVVFFSTSFSPIHKTFTINDYQGLNMNAYAIYYKKHCLALYVCSTEGKPGPHVTVYCPTAKLKDPEVLKEVEEAKEKLTKCGINDGIETCKDQSKKCL